MYYFISTVMKLVIILMKLKQIKKYLKNQSIIITHITHVIKSCDKSSNIFVSQCKYHIFNFITVIIFAIIMYYLPDYLIIFVNFRTKIHIHYKKSF